MVKFSVYLNRHISVMLTQQVHVVHTTSHQHRCSDVTLNKVTLTSMQLHDVKSTLMLRCMNVMCPVGFNVI